MNKLVTEMAQRAPGLLVGAIAAAVKVLMATVALITFTLIGFLVFMLVWAATTVALMPRDGDGRPDFQCDMLSVGAVHLQWTEGAATLLGLWAACATVLTLTWVVARVPDR